MRWKSGRAWALAAFMVGCSVEQGESLLQDMGAQLDFATWCADWGLQCTTGSESPVDADDMRATLALKEAFLSGQSQLTVSSDALNSGDLDSVLRDLQLEAALGPALNQMRASGFSGMQIQGGRGYAELFFQQPMAFQTSSGAWVEPSRSVRLSASGQGTFSFEGMALADASRTKRDSLGTWNFAADGSMSWSGAENVVTGIPQTFIPNVLGIDTERLPDSFDTSAVMGTLPSVVNIVLMENNRLHLDQNFFGTLLQHLDTLIESPSGRANGRAFLQIVDQVAASAVSGSHGTIQGAFKGRSRFECKSDGRKPVSVGLETQFGIERIERMSDSGIRLTFYGTKVKAKVFGPFSPTITLKRVDVYQDRIVVKDLPLVGSHTIDLNDPSGNDDVGQFKCAAR